MRLPFAGLVVSLSINLCLIDNSPVYAQAQKADSLIGILNKERQPRTRIDLLNDIAYYYYDYNDSLALLYAERALTELKKINYPKGKKLTLTLIGIGHYSAGRFGEAKRSFRQSDAIELEGAINETAYNLTMLGKIYYEVARDDSAILVFNKALKVMGDGGSPSRKAGVYRNIAQVYLAQWNHDSAYYFLSKAEELVNAARLNDYLKAEIYSWWGVYYSDKLELEKSGEYFARMCQLSAREGDNFHQIKCHLNRSDLQFQRGDLAGALTSCFDALEITKHYGFPPQQAALYLQLGSIYIALAQYDLATKYFYLALDISEKVELRRKIGDAFSGLAWVAYEQKQYSQALDLIQRSQNIRTEINNVKGLGNCHNVRGLIFLGQKDYARSLAEFDEAGRLWSSIHHEDGVSSALFNSAYVFSARGQGDEALKRQMLSVDVDMKTGNKRNLAISYNAIGEQMIMSENFREAFRYLTDAQNLALETKSNQQLLNNYNFFADYYEGIGNHKKANEYLKKARILNDTIYSRNSAVKLAEMNALYQVEQKDREIKMLNQQRELNEKELELQRTKNSRLYIIIVSVVVGLVLSIMTILGVYRYNRRLKRANISITEQSEEIQAQAEELMEANAALSRMNREIVEQKEEIQAQSEELVEANEAISRTNTSLEEAVQKRTTELRQAYQELDTFFYRSSHDFRRPITTFLGLSEVAKLTVKDSYALELFDKVSSTASHLDKMLFKLQSISNLGAQQMIFKEVALRDLVDEIVNSHDRLIAAKKIKVDVKYNVTQPFCSYPALVKIVIENLFENSIEFAGVESPFIRMDIYDEASEIVFDIEDNGQGIDRVYHSRIFDMYVRANERSKGSGLGLYIVKTAISKLGGRVTFKSELHKGSRFTVWFPGIQKNFE